MFACSYYDPRASTVVEPEFQPYLEAFEKECGCIVDYVPISFDEINPEHAGECQNYTTVIEDYQEIFIQQSWWNLYTTPAIREMLIFHELGHCALLRDHNEDMFEIETGELVPESIMYSTIPSIPTDYYLAHRATYIDELFSQGIPIGKKSGHENRFSKTP